MSSVDGQIDVDLDTDENAAIAVVEERQEVEIGELFNEDDELRLWQDSAGWSGAGYERWRSTEHRPYTATSGREDVYVAHHRLPAVVECYPVDEPIESVLDDLAAEAEADASHVKYGPARSSLR
ncbi:hypothetical protein [Halorubrum sp. HHNYT27]|uniref:hypothetical protein n=1 Tax=Halorubrum sp. HHNYT27 TaxID=3402275 RepID=UPI003EB8A20A